MKFSIAIPAYKAKYLNECISSILNQTYTDFEIVIVNDASPENISSIIGHFNDPRITYYINEKNCGAINVVDNWNKCLSYSKGDYILCMGDDDKLLPNCLSEYAKLIDLYPNLNVYHAWTEVIDENSNVIHMQEPRPIMEDVFSMIWNRWNGRRQYIGDFLFKTKELKKNGGFYKMPLGWGSDDISAYIAAKDNGIVNSQIPLFQYRVNSQTISNTSNARIKIMAINMEEDWYKNFLSSYSMKNDGTSKFLYWKLSCENLSKSMNKKRAFCLSQDMNSIHNLLHYIKNMNTYRLTKKILLYALFLFVKNKYS